MEEIDHQDYHCMLNTRMYWEAGYKIFIGHDCDIYELSIKIMMSKKDFEENMIYHSEGAQDQIIQYEDIGSGD